MHLACVIPLPGCADPGRSAAPLGSAGGGPGAGRPPDPEVPRVRVLAPAGHLRQEHCGQLRALLRVADAPGGVALDLSAVESLDSHALGALLTAQRRLRREGRDLVVVDPRPRVRRVLRTTGTGRLLGCPAEPGPRR